MLQAFGLEKEVKLNLEQNHAILAGHSFEHEIQLAAALGIFGSLDLNRGDYLLGWDTDQFAMNVGELTLALYEFLRAGGFTTGGMNFDAKIRRQSIEPDDLLHAHIGSMDATARALINAAAMMRGRRAAAACRRALCRLGRRARQIDSGGREEPRRPRRPGRGPQSRPAAPLRPPGISGEPGEPVRLARH